MVSDSVLHTSIPNASKDFAKKKRANRSAKLKQCKLDARREQWLSQVKNKNGKEEVNAASARKKAVSVSISLPVQVECGKELEVKSVRVEEEINHHNHDSDSESFPSNSPTSSVSGGNDLGNTYAGSSSSRSSSSSFSSGVRCYSGVLTEEEDCGDEDEDEDGCLDDWEAVADAMADDNQGCNSNAGFSPEREITQLPSCENEGAQGEELKRDGVGILGSGSDNCKAWRPDDAFRPQSLPNLAKQMTFPTASERLQGFTNPWVRNNMVPRVPTACPICCEDLDLTDSSFLPCPCGFHLCLFCHKRILEEDGRCPGCRKEYASEPVEKEASVSGGSLTIRLARSCSMSCSRV